MIPKVFHQIWINKENPNLPDKFAAYRDGWLKLHPDWEYKLWNLENLDFIPTHIDLINKASSYAQKSDILRYEILLRKGGVYLDTDFECLRNIDKIICGVKNFSCSEDGQSISIGILGSVQGSIYMQRCLAGLPSNLGEKSPTIETGPGLFTRVLLGHGIAGDFTLFPQGWFYPYNWDELHRADENFPNAYGVHRWAHSWKGSDKSIIQRLKRKLKNII